jgi:Flp pilus assembly protein TadG
MSPVSLLNRFVPKFARDTHGGVAMMFALAAVPMIGLSGAVVDYSAASRDRALLQTAADAAALQLAKAPATTQAQLDALVRDNFAINYTASTNRTATITVSKGLDQARITANDAVPRVFRMFPGQPTTVPISVEAEVRWGVNNVEIALALDNTGSMGSSSKMQELKRALCGDPTCSSTTPTSGFVKIIKDAATRPNQFMVGLVPFDVNVRVPQSWQNTVNSSGTTGGSFAGGAGSGYCMSGAIGNGSQGVGIYRFASRDKDIRAGSYNGGTYVGPGCGTPRMTAATWQGCVGDRDLVGDFDTMDTITISGSSDMSQRHPAVACFSNSLARMRPMSDILSTSSDIIVALRAMTPAGNTNLAIGAAWGTAMLTNREPFTEARASSDTSVRRFMILLTDGENTQSKHSNTDTAIDDRARRACAYAKSQDITIYAIRVINGDRSLLQNCASSPSHYKEVANAAALTPVFQQIANEIGALRLSH